MPCIVHCALRWYIINDYYWWTAELTAREDCGARGSRHPVSPTQVRPIQAQLNLLNNRDANNYVNIFSLSGTQDPWWMFNRTWLGRCQQAPPGQQHTFAAPFPKLEKPSAGTQGKLCDNWILPANSQTGCDRHNAHFGKLINLEDLNVAANYRTGFATLLPRPSRTGLTTCCLPLKVK